LCCLFLEEPILFRTTTARALMQLPRRQQRTKISEICLHNVQTLFRAVEAVHRMGIGAFRIQSGLFPRRTHPEVGYEPDQLPDAAEIGRFLIQVGAFARKQDIRLSFHPDQFVVLNAPDAGVVARSVAELEYQAAIAEVVGADVITLHGGGVHGDKASALDRLAENVSRLPGPVRARLAFENDDLRYTVADLAPLCSTMKTPLVYDVHHHRCNPDGLSVAEATAAAVNTWSRLKREPYFHISSPRDTWAAGNPRPHADYLNPADIPAEWQTLDRYTVDVEAKAKERAVLKAMQDWPRGKS